MTDCIMVVALLLVALAVLTFIVKTVIYAIEVFMTSKMSKKTFKMCKNLISKYDSLFDKMSKMMMDDDD